MVDQINESVRSKPLGRYRHRHEFYIKVDHNEIGWGGMDWIHLDQGTDKWQAVMKTVNEPLGVIECG